MYNFILRRLTRTTRYNGKFMIKSESVAEHSADLFYTMLPLCKSLKFTRQELSEFAYRCLIHDADESILCDIPRSLKYLTKEITKALDEGVKSILSGELPDDLISEISTCKDESKFGYLLKLGDAIQARYVMYREFAELGNQEFEVDLRVTNKSYITDLNNLIQKSNEIFDDFEKSIIKDFIEKSLNSTKVN